MARFGCHGVRAGEFTLNPPEQHKNDNDDQDGADEPNTAMSVAVTVTAETATETAKQKNDEDDDEDEPERHGLSLQFVVLIGGKSQAGVCAILLISSRLVARRIPEGIRHGPIGVGMPEEYRQRLSRFRRPGRCGLSVARWPLRAILIPGLFVLI